MHTQTKLYQINIDIPLDIAFHLEGYMSCYSEDKHLSVSIVKYDGKKCTTFFFHDEIAEDIHWGKLREMDPNTVSISIKMQFGIKSSL